MREKRDIYKQKNITQIITQLEQTNASLTTLDLGGNRFDPETDHFFFPLGITEEEQLALMDRLVTLLQKNTPQKLRLHKLPDDSEKGLALNATFFDKIIAGLTLSSVSELFVDFLGIQALLRHLPNLNTVRNLKLVYMAHEFIAFTYIPIYWPPHLSELSLKVSNWLHVDQPTVNKTVIKYSLCALIEQILKTKELPTENTTPLKKLHLEVDSPLDLAFFKQLQSILKDFENKHYLEELVIGSPVNEDCTPIIVQILRENPKLQIKLHDYRLSCGMIEASTLRNSLNRNPELASVEVADDGEYMTPSLSGSASDDEEKKPQDTPPRSLPRTAADTFSNSSLTTSPYRLLSPKNKRSKTEEISLSFPEWSFSSP